MGSCRSGSPLSWSHSTASMSSSSSVGIGALGDAGGEGLLKQGLDSIIIFRKHRNWTCQTTMKMRKTPRRMNVRIFSAETATKTRQHWKEQLCRHGSWRISMMTTKLETGTWLTSEVVCASVVPGGAQ